MRAWILTTILCLSTVASAATLNTSSDEPADPTRESNRLALLARWGDTYDPDESRVVSNGDGSSVTVNGARDLEMHLDFFAAQGIVLNDLRQTPQASSVPTFMVGAFRFDEEGWYQEGARCPTYTPLTVVEVRELLDRDPAREERLGEIASTVAEHPETIKLGKKFLVDSWIYHWEIGNDPELSTRADASYLTTGMSWYGAYMVDWFCSYPSNGQGVVRHQSLVRAEIERTDP